MTRGALLVLLGAIGIVTACGRAAPAPQSSAPQVRPATPAAETDALFAEVLAAVVDDQGLVRYDKLAEPELRGKLQAVVRAYAGARRSTNPSQRLALWCNAYNANVLDRVVVARAKPGFVNVVEVDGFFDKQQITVGGEKLTLNDLENKRIRPLGDARIHAALVCAAMSCPVLRNDPYRPALLDRQFDEQCRRWINDAGKNGASGNSASVSRIFEWYGDDFRAEGVAAFLRRYAEPDGALGRLLATNPTPRIVFRDYDWTLNLSAGQP